MALAKPSELGRSVGRFGVGGDFGKSHPRAVDAVGELRGFDGVRLDHLRC